MQNRILNKLLILLALAFITSACKEVVVKVEKKPKKVDLSSTAESEKELNFTDSEDFLKHLDDLRVVAADFLIKQLSSRDFRGEFRQAVRDYRTFLIDRASATHEPNLDFYLSDDECRVRKLSFNLNEANDFLGLILKTAALAKMSEVSASKVNPALSNELQAIGQIIMIELGIDLEGSVEVEKDGDTQSTTGSFSLALKPLEGEDIDDATKAADASEKISIKFARDLGKEHTGTFEAAIEVIHYLGGEGDEISTETLSAALQVNRTKLDGKFFHTIGFELGEKDQDPTYARQLSFEQDPEEKHVLMLTDIINPGTDGEMSFKTRLDVKKGEQCKLDGAVDSTDDAGGKGGDDAGDGKGGDDAGDTGGQNEDPETIDDGTKDDGKTTTDQGDQDKGDEELGGGDGNDPNQNPNQN